MIHIIHLPHNLPQNVMSILLILILQYFLYFQVAVQQLRDRLSRALGQQALATALAPVAQVQPQPPTPFFAPQPTDAQSRQLFTPAQPPMVPQLPAPAPARVPVAALAPHQYYQPVSDSESNITSL